MHDKGPYERRWEPGEEQRPGVSVSDDVTDLEIPPKCPKRVLALTVSIQLLTKRFVGCRVYTCDVAASSVDDGAHFAEHVFEVTVMFCHNQYKA